MNIALDYDDTFTLDPTFWLMFIAAAELSGHTVHIVTARLWEMAPDVVEALPNRHIWCTALTPKRAYMEDQGIRFDVWIDDWPEWICGCAA